jgi:hypothetical protein
MTAADNVSIFVSSEATIRTGEGSKLFGVGEGVLWEVTDAVCVDSSGVEAGVSAAGLSVNIFGSEQAGRRIRIRIKDGIIFFKYSPAGKCGQMLID